MPGGPWGKQNQPALAHRLLSAAADTNSTLVRAGAGNVSRIIGHNAAAAVRYIKLYDKATAPTVGTDTPKLTLAVPASAPFNIDLAGFPFALGIGFGIVTGAADNSTAAPVAGDILGLNILYR